MRKITESKHSAAGAAWSPLGTTSDGPFSRSGDPGFALGNHLFVAAQTKDLVGMRGARYYPPDIDLTAWRAIPVLRPGCGAVLTAKARGREPLVVACEDLTTATDYVFAAPIDRDLDTRYAGMRRPMRTRQPAVSTPHPAITTLRARVPSSGQPDLSSAPAESGRPADGRAGTRWYRWLNGSRVAAIAYGDMVARPAWAT